MLETSAIRTFFTAGGSIVDAVIEFGITRASAKHYHIEWKQDSGIGGSGQHSDRKVAQALGLLDSLSKPKRAVEFFSGVSGALSSAYLEYGLNLQRYDKKLGTGDSFRAVHKELADGNTYDLVDLDPYGYAVRMFPAVFALIDDGGLLLTLPKPGCNHGNHITWQMVKSHFGKQNPDIREVLDTLWWWAISHWREISLHSLIDFGRVWRIALRVRRVKATLYMGVRNRPEMPEMTPAMKSPPNWVYKK